MKYRISHESKLFHYGIMIPWAVAGAALLGFIGLGFNISNETASKVLLGICAVCGLAVILFMILFVIEKICGATITVQNNYVDIRMLLRHKRFYFDQIVDAKYSHYRENDNVDESVDGYATSRRIRSVLTFTMLSGEVCVLNDKATGYAKKRKQWIAHPNMDPDEDVKLYQAYRCFVSAHDSYMYERSPAGRKAASRRNANTMREI